MLKEEIKLPKKYNSAESHKENQIQFFIAKIEPNMEKEDSQEEKILFGEELKIESRRKKAFEIINSIKEGEDELKCIKHSLQYHNTNKYTISIIEILL